MPMSKSDWELDPLVRNARSDFGRAWVRVIIAAVVSSFLFEFLNVAIGVIWLATSVAVEGASAIVRRRVRSSDLRWGPAYIFCLFASSLVWVAHGLLLWNSGEDLARYAALFSLFSVSLYAANGGATDRRLVVALLAAPVITLMAIVLAYVWPSYPVHVALFTSLSTFGACAVIVLNAFVMLRSNEKLVQSAQALSAAARAKDSFLADVSHEIRTPLNGVLALAGALERTPLDAKQREMVALISGSGETMRRLVTGMLDLAKIESGHLGLNATEFDLAAEIEAAALPQRPRAEEKGLYLALTIEDEARGRYKGDALRLRQIVANLTSNAVKFTQSGGVDVRVSAAAGPDGRITLAVTVSDTGPGMSAVARDLLFKRFSQLESGAAVEGGTGLGLSISQALAELMGGAISVRSTLGEGSDFVFAAPFERIGDAVEGQAQAVAQTRADAAAEALRILLAEDHPVNRRAIELILEPFGALITPAENGRLAVEAYAASTFDLVLMDKRMPVLDGLEALREIRAHEAALGRERTPVLMLSADAAPHDLEEAESAGCDGYVPKPITPDVLFAAIQDALEARRRSP